LPGAFALASAAVWRIEPVLAQSEQGRELATMTIVQLAQLLASQKITSRQLVEQALVAIKDPKGEGSRTFLTVHESEALAAADRIDSQRRGGTKLPALTGIPISIKDLFDETGVTTLSGSKVLVGTPAATRDSTVVERRCYKCPTAIILLHQRRPATSSLTVRQLENRISGATSARNTAGLGQPVHEFAGPENL
jgi:hypothetical protein